MDFRELTEPELTEPELGEPELGVEIWQTHYCLKKVVGFRS